MPNHSSACDPSSLDRSDRGDRAHIAAELYLQRGAREACNRCDTNDRLGARDLFVELVRALRLEPHHTVVDVCAGAGQHVVRYAKLVSRAVGYDFSEAAVAEARARGAEAYVADGAALPLADASADAVSCCFGVYYLPDVKAAVHEWARVLKPGGRLVVCGPAHGTNVELYAFHQQATGEGPSDADTMALGHIDDFVRPALEAAPFRDITVDAFVNPVEFPDAEAFLHYWRNTSLFARSPRANVDAGARLLAGRTGPFPITKRVSIASATRTA